MSGEPEVSVVIPTRDRARFLPDAVATSLGQEGVDLEVIVVDDGSRDDTPSLLAGVADPRLRVLRLEPSRGQTEARIAGIKAARGRWLAFLDDDDLWAPSKLRLQLEAAERAGATWVYCGVLLVSPEGDVVRVEGPSDPEAVLKALLRSNVVQAGASTVIVEAARYHAVGGFEDGLSNPWDLCIRLAADGRAAAVDDALVAYRRHPGTRIAGSRGPALEEARHIAAKHRHLALDHGTAFDLEQYRRWLDSERLRGLRSLATLRLARGQRFGALRAQLKALAVGRKLVDLRRLLGIAAGERTKAVLRRAAPRVEQSRQGEAIPDWLAPYLEDRVDVRRSSSSTDTAGTVGATSERAKTTLKP